MVHSSQALVIPGGDGAAPELYQPSNGIEGACFMELFCDRCTRDAAFRAGTGDSCEIVANTMVYSVDDEAYPREWIYGPDDAPTCTAFEAEAAIITDKQVGISALRGNEPSQNPLQEGVKP